MNHTFKHRNSFLRISVLLLLLTLISNTNIRNANADETTNSLKLTLRETEYKISDNTLSISPEKETAYTVEILLENVGSGDSSIVVTPYTSTALSRESAIIYSEDLTLLLDDKYNFSNYALIEMDDFERTIRQFLAHIDVERGLSKATANTKAPVTIWDLWRPICWPNVGRSYKNRGT